MRWLACLSLLVCGSWAHADQLYVFVSVTCTPKLVEVKFERAWNEAGKAIISARAPSTWHTDELRSIASADDVHYETTPRPKSVRCSLAGIEVRILVEPEFAPRWSPVGECAARTGAKVKIHRGDSLVDTEGLDACTELGEVPVSIRIFASGAPIISRISAQEFIHGPYRTIP
ncbi:hypothetical protein [Rhizobacter sp. P5_C2]